MHFTNSKIYKKNIVCKKLLIIFSRKWIICYLIQNLPFRTSNVISQALAIFYFESFCTGDKESTNLKESKNKSRTDLSAMIAEQLMMPLHDFGPQKVVSTEPVDMKSSETTGVETNQDKEVKYMSFKNLFDFCTFSKKS